MSNDGWGDDVSDRHKAQLDALGKLIDLGMSAETLADAGVPMAAVVGPALEALHNARQVQALAEFWAAQAPPSGEPVATWSPEMQALRERLRAGDYHEDGPEDEDMPVVFRDSTGREFRAQPAPARSERSRPVGPVALDALCSADADPSVNPYREVRDALEARLAFGVAKYGAALTTHNGRDALRDALEEALDGMQYAAQANLEARDEDAHDAALWAEDARRMFAAAARSLLWAERARARGGR